jgi:hypothetical protein
MFWASANDEPFWPPLLPADMPTSIKHKGRYKYIDFCPPLGRCGFIESTPLEGQAAPSPWWWCL